MLHSLLFLFALTLTLSPRRGNTCANLLTQESGPRFALTLSPFNAATIYPLSLEGEGWGEGVSQANRAG